MTHPLITAALVMPKTHKVVATYTNGKIRVLEVRSLRVAENHAILERRKIGRKLISRETGESVCVVRVDVLPIS